MFLNDFSDCEVVDLTEIFKQCKTMTWKGSQLLKENELPYGTKWAHIGPKWGHMGTFGPIYLGPIWPILDHMGPWAWAPPDPAGPGPWARAPPNPAGPGPS